MAVGEPSSPTDPGGGRSHDSEETTHDGGTSGLRRRRSSATDDEELGQANTTPPASYQVEAPVGRRRSVGSNASTHRRQKSLSSAVDYEGVIGQDSEQERRSSKDSGDNPKVVRFSTDVPREQQPQNPRSNSEGGTATRHAAGLGLSVITSNDADNVLGAGNQTSSTAQPSDPQRSGSFPLSPKTRSRGWSLRRTLLNRNLDDSDTRASTAAAAARNSIIELDEVSSPSPGSSRPQAFDAITSPNRSDRSTSSKKSDHIVIISPGIDQHSGTDHHSDSTFPDRQTLKKGLQGISALPHYESWILERARHNAHLKRIQAGYHKLRKIILRIQEIPPSKDGRHIPLDASRKKALIDERTGRPYVENWIRSSRYSAWNFVPRQLFAQFSKLANFYFLVVSILQMIPSKSVPTSSFGFG